MYELLLRHNFLSKITLISTKVAKLRRIWLQTMSRVNKLELSVYISLARIVTNHVGSFKPLLRPGSHTKDLLIRLSRNYYRFEWIPPFLKSPQYPAFPVLIGCDLPYSPSKAAGITVSKVLILGCFYRELYWFHKVNISSFKLPGHVWIYKGLSHIWPFLGVPWWSNG